MASYARIDPIESATTQTCPVNPLPSSDLKNSSEQTGMIDETNWIEADLFTLIDDVGPVDGFRDVLLVIRRRRR